MQERSEWDVAVVGGGPAGLAAASASAAAGARTIVLERAEHPRYKTCGGGLLGVSDRMADLDDWGRLTLERLSSKRPSPAPFDELPD